MPILRSDDGDSLLLDCTCGCDNGLRMRVHRYDDRLFSIITYTSGNFQREQDETVFGVLKKKLRKIFCILRGKDYCYSEVCLTKQDFEEFRAFLADFDCTPSEHDDEED